MSSCILSLVLTVLFASYTTAHTWIEQMQLISSDGKYTGDLGYPRGYVARTDRNFNGYSDKWQLPSPEHDLGRIRINSSDLLCHPAQRTANYTTQYPKLKVSPDSYIAMKYLENGHVTQPWVPAGKPAGSGPVFVYGTYTPSDSEKIVDVLQWTTDGKGGNGKGFLMTAQNYDDDRCYQPNVSPISVSRQMTDPDKTPTQESWCETDLHIPADVKAGSTLTLYWVWSWQTSTATEGAPCGKDEYYTTCADVDITGPSVNAKALFVAPVVHTLIQQDPRVHAVSDYKSRTAFQTTPDLVTTEACGVTSITTSRLPDTLTKPTSLPAGFLATLINNVVDKPMPPSPSTSPAGVLTANGRMPALSSSTSSSLSSPNMATTTVTHFSVQTVTYIPPSVTEEAVQASTSSSKSSTTTTIRISSTSAVPQISFAPVNAVADANGMIGQISNVGMIGQRDTRRRAVAFVG